MDTQEPMAPGTDDLDLLLGELRQAGEEPDRALLDRVKAHGQAAVRPLIEMALDEELHDAPTESPEVWAPLHALQILGELGAPEAVEPLLPLFDRTDDEWLPEALAAAFGGIGASAVAPLRALLVDRTRDVWARVTAARCLSTIGQRHPELRSEVVNTLVARLDPAESQTPEDEILNGFVISRLLDIKATEAAPEIRRAFDEDRVDTSIVDLDGALEALGLAPAVSRPEPGPDWLVPSSSLRLRLRCTACRYEREHQVEMVYYDMATAERRQRGEPVRYSEFFIPQRITCSKCGAVDQYELSSMALLTLTAELVKQIAAREQGVPGGKPGEGVLRFVRMGLADGREMHPIEAREMYRQRVEAEPDRPELRVRYANVLRAFNYREEAAEQYQAALRLEPVSLEALLNLGRLALAAGDRVEARRMYESIITQAPHSGLPRQDQDAYIEAATGELADLDGEHAPAIASRMLTELDLIPIQSAPAPRALVTRRQPVRAAPKVGRNDPCPCGSGKKYKRCHGR